MEATNGPIKLAIAAVGLMLAMTGVTYLLLVNSGAYAEANRFVRAD